MELIVGVVMAVELAVVYSAVIAIVELDARFAVELIAFPDLIFRCECSGFCRCLKA